MNKELKQDIAELVLLTKGAIKYLNGKKKWFKVTKQNVSELFDRFDVVGGVDNLSEDDMVLEIKNSLLERSLLECNAFASRMVDDLKSYLDSSDDDSFVYDIYEHKLNQLEAILSNFDQGESQYKSIKKAIEGLEEALATLEVL